jgi:predicted ester cyclase
MTTAQAATQAHPMTALMRRYVFGFVNSQDFDVCRDELMTDDYQLHVGADTLAGRDTAYIPAVARQFRQFPTLGFTVHDLVSDGVFAALLFSEHGASRRWNGALASWIGVSIYRRSDDRLAECWVEQDYYSRLRQLESGIAAPVEPAAIDPWADAVREPDPHSQLLVRNWLESADWYSAGSWNPGPYEMHNPILRINHTEPTIIVATRERAAFSARVRAEYCGGIPGLEAGIGMTVTAYAAGLVEVNDRRIPWAKGVLGRLDIEQALKAAQANEDSGSSREEPT